VSIRRRLDQLGVKLEAMTADHDHDHGHQGHSRLMSAEERAAYQRIDARSYVESQAWLVALFEKYGIHVRALSEEARTKLCEGEEVPPYTFSERVFSHLEELEGGILAGDTEEQRARDLLVYRRYTLRAKVPQHPYLKRGRGFA
jgi:hypothetical protein